jgi:formylglycine-generating enzyme required for sulfatase activity
VRWNPAEGSELRRVIRGGCYQGPDSFSRASARWGREPGNASHRIGFRVVLAPE